MLTIRPRDRADHGAQQVDRVGVAPALVVVGEERADVAHAGGAEQGVDHRVGEHVGVGVAGEAALVLDLDPAEDQAPPLGEAVAVVADADAHRSRFSRYRGRQRLQPALRGARRRRSPRRPSSPRNSSARS